MFDYDWPRLHAVLNDLPAALFVAAVFFDVTGAVTKRPPFRQVGFWTLILGTLGGIAAVLSGLQAEDSIAHGSEVHEIMERHELFGLITLGIFGTLAVWRIFREGKMAGTERLVATVLSLAGIVTLFTTGMYGGRMVFEHAAGIPSAVLTAEMASRAAGHTHHHGDAHDADADDHEHPATGIADTAATASAGATLDSTAHADPPGTPPHTHKQPHTHPPGTAPHQD